MCIRQIGTDIAILSPHGIGFLIGLCPPYRLNILQTGRFKALTARILLGFVANRGDDNIGGNSEWIFPGSYMKLHKLTISPD